ncbi:AraC family transcriptional regulator [Lentisphaera profundi]|uniref:AraC family transcriptional regulator n=1 Tax=Lentisphaera profundi TaxID=1658616 RepID=A0ABY7W0B4_9BACT|nr:AraC family transcriptional regulator [Lentisphaera profundi]WDE99397.1 AraC family transcriptional regulator [Lentisphaera profundi]
MKQVDTTSPKAHSRLKSLLENKSSLTIMAISNNFRVQLANIYHSQIGPEWDSNGKSQSDYLHHIEIPISGHRQVIHQKNTLDIRPESSYFMPGNTPVVRRHLQSGRSLWLTFRCEYLPGVDPLLDWAERRPMKITSFDLSYLKQWLNPDYQLNSNNLLLLRTQVEACLTELLPSLSELISQHLATHSQFESIFQYIEENLSADLRISDLANIYGCSAHAFSQSFSSVINCTPKEYLNRRLNQLAIELLIGSELNIKEIAYRLRFGDEFYFSRFFKKLNGVSPAIYRKKIHSPMI